IKGAEPTDAEIAKAHTLCEGTGKAVLIFAGGIKIPETNNLSVAQAFHYVRMYEPAEVEYGGMVVWCQCRKCKQFMLYSIEDDRLPMVRLGQCKCSGGETVYQMDTPALLRAYTAARSARFEHGECG
ncbi:MAG: hypothetical protein WC648_05100, partial [Candidatus Paceibacterota bacterium]